MKSTPPNPPLVKGRSFTIPLPRLIKAGTIIQKSPPLQGGVGGGIQKL